MGRPLPMKMDMEEKRGMNFEGKVLKQLQKSYESTREIEVIIRPEESGNKRGKGTESI